eukprot:4048852-Prymnesium_polylepis.1
MLVVQVAAAATLMAAVAAVVAVVIVVSVATVVEIVMAFTAGTIGCLQFKEVSDRTWCVDPDVRRRCVAQVCEYVERRRVRELW